MLNLIRADVYKLLKSTSFRVCGVLFLLLAGSENFLYHLVEKMGGGTGTQTTVLSRIQGTDTSYLILLAIVISLFIGSEYTYGTIKNLASKHYERNEIFASKWIVSVLLATVYFAVSIVIVGITAAFYWKTGDLSGNVINSGPQYHFSVCHGRLCNKEDTVCPSGCHHWAGRYRNHCIIWRYGTHKTIGAYGAAVKILAGQHAVYDHSERRTTC